MPPYCENCGAIETPTWRKAYGKVFTEGFENLKASDEDGGIIAWDNVKTNAEGKVTSFRVIKKALLKGEGEEWHRTLDGARDHLHALVMAKLGDLTNQMAAARQLLAKAKKMEARPL